MTNQKTKPFEHYQLGFPVEKYPYADAKGKVLYWSCRFEPKAFRQCSADGLSWTVKDIRKVPYNLPKVIESDTVFICEGEKDCHSLAKLNLVGTCNVGGAGNWTEDLNPYFENKKIFLIPDNDEPGRKHVTKVFKNLNHHTGGPPIKLIELPGLKEHGDFTDWLNIFFNGKPEKAAERFSMMIEGAKPYSPLEDIENKPTPAAYFEFIHNADILENLKPIEWRIENILENNSLYYNFGEAGHFKTFVEIDRLLHIASGVNYYGHGVKQGPVFYICGEGQQGIGRRIAVWHIHHKTNPREIPFYVSKIPTQLVDSEALEQVKRAIDSIMAEYKEPPAIVHVDTLARNFGEGDENFTKDMNKVIINLDTIFGTDIGRGLTHHTGHLNKDRARGSYALHGAADAAFRVEYRSDAKIQVTCQKMKDAPLAPPMLFKAVEIPLQIGNEKSGSFVLELEAEGDEVGIRDVETKKIDAVVTALKSMGGYVGSQTPLKNEVMLKLKCSEATARRAIRQALGLKKIVTNSGKKKGSSTSYTLPEM